MKKHPILCSALLLLLCMVLFSSCGTAQDPAETTGSSEASTAADETRNNPARPYEGLYTESRTGAGSLELTLKGEKEAIIAVRWNDGSDRTLLWNMSGTFNARKNILEYEDCIKISDTIDPENGTISEILYRGGKGSFSFENNEIRWTDDEEHFADDAVFIRP